MENKRKIASVFQEAQRTRFSHERCMNILINIFKKVPFEEFANFFISCILLTFNYDINTEYVENSMHFASMFLAKLVKLESRNEDNSEEPTHPLLKKVILDTLKHHNNSNHRIRYHACNFVSIILGEAIEDDFILDNDLCDVIQTAMLERILDTKSIIRKIAVETLKGLQSPVYNECPIISTYLNTFNDSNPSVRAKVVQVCAPSKELLVNIIKSVSDENAIVRIQAYRKLALLKPTWLKISDRQEILRVGFQDKDKMTAKVFREVLLPKWLLAFEGDFVKLLKHVCLDTDEKDLESTDLICKQMIEVYLKSHKIQEFLDYLPLQEDHLVPYQNLQYELALYWNILFNVLNKNQEMTDCSEFFGPQLITFCKYIEEFTSNKTKEDVHLKRCQYLEYQYILLKLLDMLFVYDWADEVGRKTVHQLAIDILSKRMIERPVIKKLLMILEKLAPNTNQFIDEVIEINMSILTPVVENEPSKQAIQEHKYKLAELDVKLNILNEEVEEATVLKDYLLAAEKQEEFKALQKQKEVLLANQPGVSQHSNTNVNKNRMVHAMLDVLNCLLMFKTVNRTTPTLSSFVNEHLGEMNAFLDIEHQRLAFKSCCLYALLDKQWAAKYLTFIYKPILLYRTRQREFDMTLLETSLLTVSDILCTYGKDLFKTLENVNGCNHSKRRLYNPDCDDMDGDALEEVTIQHLIDIIVSMISSEVIEIRKTASNVLAKIIGQGLYVSSGLFTRIFIEWCNPQNFHLYQEQQLVFGCSIFKFAHSMPGAQAVIEESILPSLYIIGNSPKPYSLAEIDNVINILCKLLLPLNGSSSNSHTNIAYLLCNTLDRELEDKCAIIWVKMLIALNPPSNDRTALVELKGFVEGFLEDVNNNNVKVKLKKYYAILLKEIENLDQNAIEENKESNESKENDAAEIKLTENDNQDKMTDNDANVDETTKDVNSNETPESGICINNSPTPCCSKSSRKSVSNFSTESEKRLLSDSESDDYIRNPRKKLSIQRDDKSNAENIPPERMNNLEPPSNRSKRLLGAEISPEKPVVVLQNIVYQKSVKGSETQATKNGQVTKGKNNEKVEKSVVNESKKQLNTKSGGNNSQSAEGSETKTNKDDGITKSNEKVDKSAVKGSKERLNTRSRRDNSQSVERHETKSTKNDENTKMKSNEKVDKSAVKGSKERLNTSSRRNNSQFVERSEIKTPKNNKVTRMKSNETVDKAAVDESGEQLNIRSRRNNSQSVERSDTKIPKNDKMTRMKSNDTLNKAAVDESREQLNTRSRRNNSQSMERIKINNDEITKMKSNGKVDKSVVNGSKERLNTSSRRTQSVERSGIKTPKNNKMTRMKNNETVDKAAVDESGEQLNRRSRRNNSQSMERIKINNDGIMNMKSNGKVDKSVVNGSKERLNTSSRRTQSVERSEIKTPKNNKMTRMKSNETVDKAAVDESREQLNRRSRRNNSQSMERIKINNDGIMEMKSNGKVDKYAVNRSKERLNTSSRRNNSQSVERSEIKTPKNNKMTRMKSNETVDKAAVYESREQRNTRCKRNNSQSVERSEINTPKNNKKMRMKSNETVDRAAVNGCKERLNTRSMNNSQSVERSETKTTKNDVFKKMKSNERVNKSSVNMSHENNSLSGNHQNFKANKETSNVSNINPKKRKSIHATPMENKRSKQIKLSKTRNRK